MSTINVTNLSGRGGATPNLPDGANITGVATATTFSGTLDGSLKTTGTPTLGLGVTINSSGLAISGVATAGIGSFTTVYGDGSNLTGVGESIAPWYYNPDPNDVLVMPQTGIGITFNKKVIAGSGTATIKIVNAGVAGTTVQSWGITSFTQAGVTEITLGSLVTGLTVDQTYEISYPSGFLKDGNNTDYVGTAYTFSIVSGQVKLFVVGDNTNGELGNSNRTDYSSPVQVPGSDWADSHNDNCRDAKFVLQPLTDGTMFGWGYNSQGQLGLGDDASRSSPTQLSGTTWSSSSAGNNCSMALKTDGTLWGMGENDNGQCANPGAVGSNINSPVQVPGTTWSTGQKKLSMSQSKFGLSIKTDNTLWAWGYNGFGTLGQNNTTQYSSPVQIPGTTWSRVSTGDYHVIATKTNGTLWIWGNGNTGKLGQNQPVNSDYSSPIQIPGTTWSNVGTTELGSVATKTDGTLWTWGNNNTGGLGQNNLTQYSSPVQVGSDTTWDKIAGGEGYIVAIKTDSTLWAWGRNDRGLGNNNVTVVSSPVQIGSEIEYTSVRVKNDGWIAVLNDKTP